MVTLKESENNQISSLKDKGNIIIRSIVLIVGLYFGLLMRVGGGIIVESGAISGYPMTLELVAQIVFRLPFLLLARWGYLGIVGYWEIKWNRNDNEVSFIKRRFFNLAFKGLFILYEPDKGSIVLIREIFSQEHEKIPVAWYYQWSVFDKKTNEEQKIPVHFNFPDDKLKKMMGELFKIDFMLADKAKEIQTVEIIKEEVGNKFAIFVILSSIDFLLLISGVEVFNLMLSLNNDELLMVFMVVYIILILSLGPIGMIYGVYFITAPTLGSLFLSSPYLDHKSAKATMKYIGVLTFTFGYTILFLFANLFLTNEMNRIGLFQIDIVKIFWLEALGLLSISLIMLVILIFIVMPIMVLYIGQNNNKNRKLEGAVEHF